MRQNNANGLVCTKDCVSCLYPVDSAVHDVFEAVRPGGPCVDGVPVTRVREPVLSQGGGQHKPKLVAQFHGVHPRVDVQDQVHLERLGLAMQPASWRCRFGHSLNFNFVELHF